MDLARPLIVIGTGRCGSTAIFAALARHPHLAYLSGLAERYPARPGLNRAFLRLTAWPWVGPVLARRFPPAEAYAFWDRFDRGFRRPCRDLTASDPRPGVATRMHRAFSAITTGQRTRLALKITGWSRIGYLNALFPDARFVHILRDGRAVANSLLNVGFWRGWQGPSHWRWGELSEEDRRVWEAHDHSFTALAGLQWAILVRALDRAKRDLEPERFLEIKYEDFCADPATHLRAITDFAGLDWRPAFAKTVARLGFVNANDKWRRQLDDRQQGILESVLAADLAARGYEV